MTIENLKQIAIKYATTKGSRVPLAPDELCNAVVQYFNEFLKITADINTIQVAVTEEGGNIVFTITGNTLDGKAFTPIVITVDHNDFVTNQEFEEFKTTTNAAIQKNTESINSLSFRVEDTENDITTIQVQVGQINTRVGNTETNIAEINSTLNNKLDKISSVSNSNQVYGKSAAGENLMYNLESHPNAGFVLQYDNDGNIYVNKGSSEYTPANMQNISDVEAKIPSTTNLADVTKENTFTNVNHFTQSITSFGVEIGTGNADDDEYDVSIQESNIAIFHYISGSKANSLRITENKIMTLVYPSNEYNIFDFPNKSGTLALTSDINSLSFRVEDTENDITTIQVQVGQINTRVGNTETNIAEINSTLNNKLDKISSVSNSNQVYGKSAAGENLMYNLESHPNAGFVLQYDNDGNIYVNKGSSEYTPANMQNISDVEAKIPSTTNLADVTKENTFTNVNHFTQSITSFGVEIGTGNADDDEYDVSIQESNIAIFHYISGSKANSLRITENKIMTLVYPSNEYNIFDFPNKSGTLALTSDIITNHIYFISFYANEPSESCHLIGTMMSKNSYGTGQKTNDEFAVMLADNLYKNSNEGLAAYGKLAKKDILCIYSDDGLSIRCLDEENSEVDLPTVMFFVMETEL